MNAQEIIQFIGNAEKKTPVRMFVKEKNPIDYGSARVFGTGDKIVFGDWKELSSAIEALYPGFNEDIMSRLPNPKASLLRTCYLMKAGLTNPEIEHIMNVPHQTVWYRVNKIREVAGDLLEDSRQEQTQP